MMTLARHVIKSIMDGEVILMDTENGTYFGINRTGSIMLEALLEYPDISFVIKHIRELFSIDEETAKKDVHKIVSDLLERNLVVYS